MQNPKLLPQITTQCITYAYVCYYYQQYYTENNFSMLISSQVGHYPSVYDCSIIIIIDFILLIFAQSSRYCWLVSFIQTSSLSQELGMPIIIIIILTFECYEGADKNSTATICGSFCNWSLTLNLTFRCLLHNWSDLFCIVAKSSVKLVRKKMKLLFLFDTFQR